MGRLHDSRNREESESPTAGDRTQADRDPTPLARPPTDIAELVGDGIEMTQGVEPLSFKGQELGRSIGNAGLNLSSAIGWCL